MPSTATCARKTCAIPGLQWPVSTLRARLSTGQAASKPKLGDAPWPKQDEPAETDGLDARPDGLRSCHVCSIRAATKGQQRAGVSLHQRRVVRVQRRCQHLPAKAWTVGDGILGHRAIICAEATPELLAFLLDPAIVPLVGLRTCKGTRSTSRRILSSCLFSRFWFLAWSSHGNYRPCKTAVQRV